MSFKNKFTTAELKQADEKEKQKIEVSNDAYLNAEMIEALIKKIEHARVSLMK